MSAGLPVLLIVRFCELVTASGEFGLEQPILGQAARVLKLHLTAVSAWAVGERRRDRAITNPGIFTGIANSISWDLEKGRFVGRGKSGQHCQPLEIGCQVGNYLTCSDETAVIRFSDDGSAASLNSGEAVP